MLVYALLWAVLLPVILIYLWRRGRKDPMYAQHLSERMGRYQPRVANPVWVHAVSLGEMRSATPLVRALLAQGETIVTTHFTPAGRREVMREFAAEIAQNKVQPVWVPFEFKFAFRGFLKAFRPQYGLVMEIEIWPQMIMTCRKDGTPLFMCNAQYPLKSFERDTTRTRLRGEVMRGFAGAFVKSEMQQERFAAVGVENIHVTGELRFDQPIPRHLVRAGEALRAQVPVRPVIALTSVIEGEDAALIEMMQRLRGQVIFVYVPRAPERFDAVHAMLVATSLRVLRRSGVLDAGFAPNKDLGDFDVLLGDSMGEMYGYLAASDRAIIGGSFHAKGAHNIIEPLALKKPVIVGPHIWTIEYPVVEAMDAGVCVQVSGAQALDAELTQSAPDPDAVTKFFAAHAGATQRTINAIHRVLRK